MIPASAQSGPPTQSEPASGQPEPIPADIPAATKRVTDAATRAGLPFSLRIMPDSTHTAEDAANACGCEIDLIVKSLVFKGKTTKKPFLMLVSGKNRVNEKNIAAMVGEVVEKADADLVKRATGYTIGGVPPIGLANRLPVLMDETLMRFARVWCAAGTANTVMSVPTHVLARAVAARVIKVD